MMIASIRCNVGRTNFVATPVLDNSTCVTSLNPTILFLFKNNQGIYILRIS